MAFDTKSSPDVAAAPSPLDIVRQIIAPLASLKLTVGLLIAGLLLVLFGTLAQQYMNEFEAARNCFRTWYTWVELKWFFPKNFFPNIFLDERPSWVEGSLWGFFFPGGWTIGGLMAVNLIAAHSLRFRAQAHGARLWAGLGVIAVGCALTYFVIAAGPDKDGLEKVARLEWRDIYRYVIASLGLVAVLCGYFLSRWNALGFWQRTLLIGGAAGFGAAAVYLTYQGAEPLVKPEGIRILWQLTKGTAAGLVLYLGSWLAFRRRAAVVVIHGGLLLMMSNEIVVHALHEENLLHVHENETVNFVMNVKTPELVLIDQSRPDEDRVTAVSISRFPLKDDAPVLRDEKLPCDVELVEYLPNSMFDLDSRSRLATAGNGLRIDIKGRNRSTGAGGGEEDVPSAHVRLIDKETKKPIGTYLLSYWFDPRLSQLTEAPILRISEVQKVTINGKPYGIALRPKRSPRDFEVTLRDVRKLDYVGTETPRSYESDIVIKDAEGVSRDVHIWMNNPVRFAGETFYQSSYGQGNKGEYSIFQVVRNEGWMIPYVACMIVVVGLLGQFGTTLIRFLNKLNHPERYADLKDNFEHVRNEANPWPPLAWVLPSAVVGATALVLLIWNWPPSAAPDTMNLYQAGKLPVAYEGRVKPWDSLARNSLRFISNREYFYDDNDKKQPAIRWLLDTMTRPETADKYKVFRVEAAELLDLFGLQQREGLRYSFKELSGKGMFVAFERYLNEIRERGDQGRTDAQSRALDLDRHLKLYLTLRTILAPPPSDVSDAEADSQYFAEYWTMRDEGWLRSAPRALPTGMKNEPWTVGLHELTALWLQDRAKQWNLTKSDEIAERLLKSMAAFPLERMARPFMIDEAADMLQKAQPGLSFDQARRVAQERMGSGANLPRELQESLLPGAVVRLRVEVAGVVRRLLANTSVQKNPAVATLRDILTTYRDNQPNQFNAAVAALETELQKIQPHEYEPAKDSFETYFNYLAIFNTSRWLYLIAFVFVGLSWLGLMRPFNNTATAIIVFTLVLHTIGLIGRIYISGRPPVTNLYSSAVFIGWGGVILGLIFEFMYGRSFGNVIAAVLGHITLAVADSLSLDGETFIVMQAVLDTNFWLATHVSCVTLGYTTTYVAGLLGLVYLFMGMFSTALTQETEKTLARMIYGTTCFALFFSFFGTVLGGLWADDSWGRFWGWDPKENGALIIVLWNAVLLHARWDGAVKERGLAILAIVGNIVTTWSWFGVNQLGIGRHSYGFTRGVVNVLLILVVGHGILAILGSFKSNWWLSVREQRSAAAASKRPPPPPKPRRKN